MRSYYLHIKISTLKPFFFSKWGETFTSLVRNYKKYYQSYGVGVISIFQSIQNLPRTPCLSMSVSIYYITFIKREINCLFLSDNNHQHLKNTDNGLPHKLPLRNFGLSDDKNRKVSRSKQISLGAQGHLRPLLWRQQTTFLSGLWLLIFWRSVTVTLL